MGNRPWVLLPTVEELDSSDVRVGFPGKCHTVKVSDQPNVGLGTEGIEEVLILAERPGIGPRRVQNPLKGRFEDYIHQILEISSHRGNLLE